MPIVYRISLQLSATKIFIGPFVVLGGVFYPQGGPPHRFASPPHNREPRTQNPERPTPTDPIASSPHFPSNRNKPPHAALHLVDLKSGGSHRVARCRLATPQGRTKTKIRAEIRARFSGGAWRGHSCLPRRDSSRRVFTASEALIQTGPVRNAA